MKEVLTGRERILQEEFVKFWFESEFCGPAKGNEKGKVENLVKYVENNYFSTEKVTTTETEDKKLKETEKDLIFLFLYKKR